MSSEVVERRAGRSFEGQPCRRRALSGPGPPLRSWRQRGEVAVDLAGDVALEDADDLGFGCVLRRGVVRRRRGCVGRELMRVNTIRHSAWLAWRLPPRLSRCRVVLPEEAWIGATPQRCAKAASVRSRSALSPAATSKMRGGVDADAVELEQARARSPRRASASSPSRRSVVGVEVDDAAAEGLHGQLGGVHDGVAVPGSGAAPAAVRARGVDGERHGSVPAAHRVR